MKRISAFTIIVLMLLPSISNARLRYYGVSSRFRTRYSPYAFSHKHPTGLISGELQYSPYAFSHKYPNGLISRELQYSPYAFSSHSSGLIPYRFRYSPYAFSHKHPSGLISDYGSYFYSPYGYYPYAQSYRYSGLVDCDTHHYEKRINPHRNRTNIDRETDGKEIIYNYLKNKNINGFQVDRIFKVDNKTVSVNFVLRDKNLIIKYWDPEHVKTLIQQPGYRRNYYEKYEQDWKDLAQKHQQAGGKIYQIETANAKEILSRLSLCPELSEG